MASEQAIKRDDEILQLCFLDWLPEAALIVLVRHLCDTSLSTFISAYPRADEISTQEWQRRRCQLKFFIQQPSILSAGATCFPRCNSKRIYFSAKDFLLQNGWHARYLDLSQPGDQQIDAERISTSNQNSATLECRARPTFVRGVHDERILCPVFYAARGNKIARISGIFPVAYSPVHASRPDFIAKDFSTDSTGERFATLDENGNIDVIRHIKSTAFEPEWRFCVTDANSIDLRMTATGGLLLGVARDNRTCDIILRDLTHEKQNVSTLHVSDRVWTTRFGYDAVQIATGSAGQPPSRAPSTSLPASSNSALQIWDVESQKRTCSVRWNRQNRGDGIRALFWHNPNTIVSGGWRAVTRVSDTRTGETQLYLVDPTDVTVACAATDSSNCIVTGGMDYNYLRVWDARNCKLPVHAFGLTTVTQQLLERRKQFYKKRLWQCNYGIVHSVAIDYSCLYAGLSDGLYCLSFGSGAPALVNTSAVESSQSSRQIIANKENFNIDQSLNMSADALNLPIVFDNVRNLLIV